MARSGLRAGRAREASDQCPYTAAGPSPPDSGVTTDTLESISSGNDLQQLMGWLTVQQEVAGLQHHPGQQLGHTVRPVYGNLPTPHLAPPEAASGLAGRGTQ